MLDGGNIWPFLIRKRDKRNIRIWLEDGSYDLENAHGSYDLENAHGGVRHYFEIDRIL